VSSRADQLLELYRDARVQDQLRYYGSRRTQFDRAHGQLLIASAVLLGATSTVAALSGTEIPGKVGWAALAAIIPAVATMLAAYGALFAFERNAKLYGDAERNLGLLEEPNVSLPDDDQAEEAVRKYVEQVEKILSDEQAQWGQLAAEPRAGSESS
jgi:SMODS and SLOG-associating 2TM effector domain 1